MDPIIIHQNFKRISKNFDGLYQSPSQLGLIYLHPQYSPWLNKVFQKRKNEEVQPLIYFMLVRHRGGSCTRTRNTRPINSGYEYEKSKKNDYGVSILKMGKGQVRVWV